MQRTSVVLRRPEFVAIKDPSERKLQVEGKVRVPAGWEGARPTLGSANGVICGVQVWSSIKRG